MPFPVLTKVGVQNLKKGLNDNLATVQASATVSSTDKNKISSTIANILTLLNEAVAGQDSDPMPWELLTSLKPDFAVLTPLLKSALGLLSDDATGACSYEDGSGHPFCIMTTQDLCSDLGGSFDGGGECP